MSIKLMTQVWEHGPEDQTETMVLLALADRANDEGTSCYPSLTEISQRCRLSRQGTVNVLDRLDENGWIERERGGGRGNPTRYHLNADRLKGSSSLTDKNSQVEQENSQADRQNSQAETDKQSSWLDGNHHEPSGNRQGECAPAREDAEAVAIYHEIMPRRANNVQKDYISTRVDDLDWWREVLQDWRAEGYSPTSVKSMLDVYENGWRDEGSGGGSPPGGPTPIFDDPSRSTEIW